MGVYMEKDDIIECEVTSIRPFGVFVKYQNYKGLIHISEISNLYVEDLSSIFEIGDTLSAYILDINEEEKQIELSYKKVLFANPNIQKRFNIRKGFHPLSKKLKEWIKEEDNEKN